MHSAVMNSVHSSTPVAAHASAAASSSHMGGGGSGSGGGGGGAAALNTELRAKVRRDREATREKGREKMLLQQQQQQHHHHHQNPMHPHAHAHNHTASSSVTNGSGRERTTSSSASAVFAERKISPRLGTKPATVVFTGGGGGGGGNGSNSSGQQRQHHNTAWHHQQQQRAPLMPSNRQPAAAQDAGTWDGGSMSSLQGIAGMMARIPSPPTLDDDASEQQMTQSTLIVKQYYALLEKCQSWQKYAGSMKAKVDLLDIENRYLRETVRKHEEEVRTLEEQMRVLKETAMMLENDGRRGERQEAYHPQHAPSVLNGGRSDSVQSDAMTVTEDYVQGVVQQKRQLRKVSLSQQQQLHHLQARAPVGHGGSRSQSSLGHYSSAGSKTEGSNENAPLLPAKPFPGAMTGSVSHEALLLGRPAAMTSRISHEHLPPLLLAKPSSAATTGSISHDPLPSRPGSRLSYRGSRGKARSRTGSYSFHDAIPIDKDDVFSTQLSSDPCLSARLPRSNSAHPIGHVTLNGAAPATTATAMGSDNDGRSGAVSALELRHYVAASNGLSTGENESDDSGEVDVVEEARQLAPLINRSGSMSISRESSLESLVRGEEHVEDEFDRVPLSATSSVPGLDAFSSLTVEDSNDLKGAHRRLYMRMRDELDAQELVRFERYVHKYDALQIEMEGAKGIINRVRRLLLPESLVRAKANERERYQLRKELAREFERIVREDAVPSSSDGNTPVVLPQSSDATAPLDVHAAG